VLDPYDRRLLTDALRPPDGYRVDGAIGTTFSLDLEALLFAPLSFARFDTQDVEGRPSPDPMALLEAVRRYAARTVVFCHAGQIAVPARDQRLFGYLEESVVEVSPRRPGALFHPKLWLLRFSSPDGAVRLRLLCPTRNLTFDRSWDTVLVLEGPLRDRQRAIALNHPLGDFVQALPGLARRPVPVGVLALVERLQDEVRRVPFEAPPGLTLGGFWPLGLDEARPWPFLERGRRTLVVSPFVTPDVLADLAASGRGHVLVSRRESLDAVAASDLAPFAGVYVLGEGAGDAPDAGSPSAPDADRPGEPTDEATAERAGATLRGLHAKLFVQEAGWDAHLWTGSANATHPAFDGNVELLVELTGSRSRAGIDAILAQRVGATGLRDLLEPYAPPEAPVPPDAVQERLERLADAARHALGRAALEARVEALPGDTPAGDAFRLTLSAARPPGLPGDVEVACWPATLREVAAVRLPTAAGGELAAFAPVSFEALTSFFAFAATARAEGRTAVARFVVNVPLQGAPADRPERLLRSLLRNRDQVLRLLRFLLAEGDATAMAELLRASAGDHQSAAGAGTAPAAPTVPLFEAMLRALDRRPETIDRVARLVESLRRGGDRGDGGGLLPEGFDEVWQPIWAVRSRQLAAGHAREDGGRPG
jgi:hypothetical protein